MKRTRVACSAILALVSMMPVVNADNPVDDDEYQVGTLSVSFEPRSDPEGRCHWTDVIIREDLTGIESTTPIDHNCFR